MKIIQKSMIEKKEKIKQIMAEKSILQTTSNPFIINLHWAFKSVSLEKFSTDSLERLFAYGVRFLSRWRVLLSFKQIMAD